jgi:DNA-binding protein HU-beta
MPWHQLTSLVVCLIPANLAAICDCGTWGEAKADAGRGMAALTEIISESLRKGESVSLIGFGTFEVRERSARTGRNPKTREELKIKASKVPAFKPGSALKAAVNR